MSAPSIAPTTAQILADPSAYQPPAPDPWWRFTGRAVEHKTGQAPGFYPWARVHSISVGAPTEARATATALQLLGAPTRHDHWHIEWTDITRCKH